MALQMNEASYSGTYAPYFIRQATYSMDTVQQGIVYVKGDIHKTHTIDRIDVQNPFSPNQATPVDDGANPFIVDGRSMTPTEANTYKEFRPRDFETNFLTEEMSTTLLARQLPPNIEGYLTMTLLDRCGEQIENGFWMGSAQYKGHVTETDPRYQIQYFNGFMQQIVNDSNVNFIASPTTITASNVFDVMDSLIADAIATKPALMKNEATTEFDAKGNEVKVMRQMMRFVMNYTVYDFISVASTTGTSFKGANINERGILEYRGYELKRIVGLQSAANTIVFCRAYDDPQYGNLWVGMNSAQDWSLKIGPTMNFSEIWAIQGKWKYATQYGWSQEMFVYTTLTQASFIAS